MIQLRYYPQAAAAEAEAAAAAEDEAAGDETVEIAHGENGTSVRIEDPTCMEFATFSLLGGVAVGLAVAWVGVRLIGRSRVRHSGKGDR